jgi:RNA polymerase sigma-70 factor (ECF subfamily)
MDAARERQFEQILAANARRLGAVARSYAAAGDCQDLYQEILLQIWRSLDRFEGRSSLETWLYRLALNTAITYRRKTTTRARHESPGDDLDARPAQDACGPPTRELQMVEEFVRSLDRVDRAVFLLYLEDLTYREMASITGLSESHVGVRINRIKKTFVERYLRG